MAITLRSELSGYTPFGVNESTVILAIEMGC